MAKPARVLAALVVLAWAGRAVAGPPAGQDLAAVRAELAQIDKALESEETVEHAAALRSLAAIDHEEVAARLLTGLSRRRANEVREAVFDALAGQKSSLKKVGPAVERAVMVEAARIGELFRKGDAGFLLNRRTGEADTESAEGKTALTASAARDRMVAAGFRALLALGHHQRFDAETLTGVLQSAEDGLVVAALEYAGRFKLEGVLPEVHRLFRMYPRDNRWETGAVVDAGGTNASAKAAWMRTFGHPGKRIPRPLVVAAIRSAVKAMTGVEVEDPEDLAALLRSREGRRPAKNGAR
jgi:hypothetical protein